MKIAILTLPLHTNYGGILQAYALQTILERMGHTVEVLQKIPGRAHPWYMMPLIYSKRMTRKLFKDWKTPIFIEQNIAKANKVIRKNTDRFISKHIHIREIMSLKDIKPSDYNAIVVGSDQIWRKIYFTAMWNAPIKDAFLDFTNGWNIRRIAYAASFGMDDIDEYRRRNIDKCSAAAKKFDAISVREDSGVEICSEKLGVTASHLVDPTMLLTKQDYLNLIPEDDDKPSHGNMLCYILDEDDNKEKIIETIAKELNLMPLKVYSSVDDIKLAAEERIQPPIEDWIRGFRDAEFVVTDSFHACVFSIIFNKPFIVIGNKERGMSRFNSLLKMFNLEERLIQSVDTDFLSSLYMLLSFDSSISSSNLVKFKENAFSFISDHIKNHEMTHSV